MRLDTEELNAIKKATEDIKGVVYLFGSRTDDTRRGGDIDLLIFSSEDPFQLSRKISVDFFMECEEKIDVVVMNPDSLTEEQQAFLNTISWQKIP